MIAAEPGKTGFVEQTVALTDLRPRWIVSITTHEGDKENGRRRQGRPGTMTRCVRRGSVALAGVLIASSLAAAAGRQPARPVPPARAPATRPQPHGDHGTPGDWKFTWPKGDSARGREVFAKLECYSCHEVKGEKFPAPIEKGAVGPELSVMGPLHEADYFVESIINPGAVIEKGKGYQAPDGSSKMPSFNDSLSVQELIDLVAFLRMLKPPPGTPAGHGGH